MKIFFLFIFMNSFLWAQEEVCPTTVQLPQVDPVITELHEHLSYHGAELEHMEKAFCKTKVPPSLESIDTYLDQKFQEAKKQDEEIHGVIFKNESEEALRTFKDLTTAMHNLGMVPWPDAQVDIQHQFQINPECEKVLCAVEKMWGEDLGKKLLYLHQKYAFNGSEFSFTHSKKFAPGEIDDVLISMEDFPAHHHPLSSNHRLSHFKGPTPVNEEGKTAIADAVMKLYEPWSNLHSLKKQYTIFHEMSHLLSHKMGKKVRNPSTGKEYFQVFDKSEEWLELSGWVQLTNDFMPKWSASKGCFASEYSAENPAEDWAEAVSAFRYNPHDFKKRCPEKYNLVKTKVFDGKEYTSEESCK